MNTDLHPWLEPVRKRWLVLMKADRIPHAVLVRGVPGSGRGALARTLAQDVLCEAGKPGQAACGQCPGCQLFLAGNHPDLHKLRPDGQLIKVTQVRAMTADLALSAHRGRCKVAILEAAGCMNVAAANALLKTLEEPPGEACLILVSDESDRLLPTITSRCRTVPVPLPDARQVAVWLGQDNDFVSLALVLTGGAPLLAREWLQDERLNQFMEFLKELAGLLSNHHTNTPLEIAARWSESFSAHWVAALSRYLSHLRQVRLGLRPALSVSVDEAWLEKMGRQLENGEKMDHVAQHLGRLSRHLSGTLKKELLLEEFLIHWQRIWL